MKTLTTFSLSIYVLPFMKKVLFSSVKNKEAKKNENHVSLSVRVSRAGSA